MTTNRAPTDEAKRRAREWLHREATVEPYDGHAERLAALIDAAERRGYERAKRDAAEACESFAKLAMSLRTGDEDDELNDEFHEHAAHSAKSIRADILALLDSGRDDTKGSSR